MKNTNNKGGFTLKVLFSFLLIVGLVLPYGGWGAKKVEAAAIKYYYDKYEEVAPNYQSYKNTRLGANSRNCQYVYGDGCVDRGNSTYEGYLSFLGVDPLTKEFKLANYVSSPQIGQTIYLMNYNRTQLIMDVVKTTSNNFDPSPGWSESGTWYGGDRLILNAGETTFIDGSKRLVQSNIIAPDGSYPENVKHTDGYWYVKKGPSNLAPTIILNTINGQTLSEVTGNNQLSIEGTLKDSDAGDSLTVKYIIDGLPNHQNKTIN